MSEAANLRDADQTGADAPQTQDRTEVQETTELHETPELQETTELQDTTGGDSATALAATADRVSDLGEREESISRAVAAVRAGECVVLPTDTVYGIGADAFSADAVQRLLDAKGRGRDMPPPVLIAEPAVMMALAIDVPERAKDLASKFWPGALTLILTAQPSLAMDLGETGGTIALRVPDHEELRELLKQTGPLAVSSANASGQPAATDLEGARVQLGDSVAVYLDGGPTPGDDPSTIVDFTRSGYGQVLRHGKISIDRLREVIPFLDDVPVESTSASSEPVAADEADDDLVLDSTATSAATDSAEGADVSESDSSELDAAPSEKGPKHPFGSGFGKSDKKKVRLGSTAVSRPRSGGDDLERLPDGTPAASTAKEISEPDADGTQAPDEAPEANTGAAVGNAEAPESDTGKPGSGRITEKVGSLGNMPRD